MLEIRDICKTYRPKNGPPVQALKSVSVKFAEKGLVFILGKSGCGKSTLLNTIGGLDKFDSGEIIIKGKSSKEFTGSDFDSYRNTFIGFIFQEYNILSEFNIEKNIALALELQGKKATPKAVQEILDMVDLGTMGKRKTTELSGGQKQRVAIARALIKEPEIIIADEPTGALDSATGIQVFETLKKLAQNKLVIVVSHDREFAEIYGDRIIEMKDGVIISDETKRKVQPQSVSDDLTMIGDDLIHIKKGHKFSQEEKEAIIKFLESKDTETIISVDPKNNERFKKVAKIDENNHTEKFTETTEADKGTREYDKNQLKLIRSRLKFKDSFKMGASSLKNKPIRLIFTILLSFIAFTIFGVVDTLSSFNRPKAVWDTVNQFDNKHVALLKEVEGKYGNDTRPWTETDIKLVSEKFPEIRLKKIVNAGLGFGSSPGNAAYNKQINLQSAELKTQNSNVAKTAFASGMMYITEAEMNTFGLTFAAGRLPETKEEIAISKHIFDCFKWANEDKISTYNDILKVEYNRIYLDGKTYTVVGVIDDHTDITKYTNLSTEEINKDYSTENKIARELSLGLTNMLYVSETYYNELLNKGLSFNGFQVYKSGEEDRSIGYQYGNFYTIEGIREMMTAQALDSKNIIHYYDNGWSSNLLNYDVYGEPIGVTNLSDGQIVLDRDILSYMIGPYTGMIESGTLKVFAESEDGSFSKELTVVGYTYNSNAELGGSAIVSPSDAEAFKQVTGGVKIVYNTLTVLCDTNTKYVSMTDLINDSTKTWHVSNDDVIDSGEVVYIKPGVSLSSLAKNDIILSEDALRDLASGEELHAIINEGLTVDFSSNGSTIFTFNVVGVSSRLAIVSRETKSKVIDPEAKGFDYVVALLSGNDIIDKEFVEYCETFNDSGCKYTIQNGATAILDNFGEIIQDVATIVFWVGIGFAVFAALLLMNFISTSISYKKREIGILRALGARSSDVFGIFFNESFVIAMINFVLATIATFVASSIISTTIIEKLGVELVLLSTGIRQVALILGVSVLTAFLASLLPVYKIAKKQPIDAINNR